MGRLAKPEFQVKKSTVPNGASNWFIIGRPNGKRVRAWFPSKEKAQAEAKERNIKIRKLGEDSARVDNSLIAMATEGATLLRPFGKTIRDAVTYYVNHLAKESNSISVSEFGAILRAEFDLRLSQNNASLRHRNTMFEALKKLEARFGSEKVKKITGLQIQEWICGRTLGGEDPG